MVEFLTEGKDTITLTPRLYQVLELLAAGNSNQGIAEELFLTVHSAENYVSEIYSILAPHLLGTSRG